MANAMSFSVSVLLLREGASWVAQCLEYDINAQGRCIAEAKSAFERTFVGQIAVDVYHDRQPLANVKQAPREYWERFLKAERLIERLSLYVPPSLLPAISIRAEACDIRIYD